MPWIHLFPSPACNLNCSYCTQKIVWKSKVSQDFLQDPKLLDFISRIPPTHIYLSGGEPLIHPGIKEFVPLAGKCGHKISFDTNISISMKKLESFLSSWNPEHIGFINISHHLVCGISLEYIESRVQLLKNAGIKHFVKYVGVPEMFPQIEKNMKYLKDRGTGASVTILQGDWKGRNLPAEYTFDETIKLLDLVTLNTHG
ncbi:MAG: radical SAM protein, partial [Candidatus Heimdallarchaeaceae archaeon]